MRCGAVTGSIVALGLLAAPLAADAQQPPKILRVGYIDIGGQPSPYFEAFREGLRGLGYVEGQTVTLEARFAAGQMARIADFANELRELRVDVIVAVGGAPVLAAKSATRTIPIVMGASPDPVEAGFVASLARPGGNVTGMTWLSAELAGKRLQLLRELAPRVSRVAVLANPSHPGEQLDRREIHAAARALGVTIQYLVVQGAPDFAEAFAAISRERAGALVTIPDAMTLFQRKQIAEFALNARLPTVAACREVTEAGGLLSYGPNLREGYKRLATYVDKIHKGAKPADLPVEQPMRFELVINMKTAKALGITFPPSIMVRVDQVIE